LHFFFFWMHTGVVYFHVTMFGL